MTASPKVSAKVVLRTQIECPHCWSRFAPEQILYISEHEDLAGDPVVGQDGMKRFLPSRFDAEGFALDERGTPCRSLACPRCHLSIPRPLLEMPPLFASIVGAPASGKSYFLASMIWKLRDSLHEHFGLTFHDADAAANQKLTEYEGLLFQNPDDDALVVLPKTQQQGDLYRSVTVDGRAIWYPKPFMFSMQPLEPHPGFQARSRNSRMLCLYDNAGEHFMPSEKTMGDVATQHLALSKAILFVFDPTQHAIFRKHCRSVSEDPQVHQAGYLTPQHQVLYEAANRIRDFKGVSLSTKYQSPLIVVVNKFDIWRPLLGVNWLDTDLIIRQTSHGLAALDLKYLEMISINVRGLLMKLSRDIVAAAEGFAENVVYIPVSSLGRSPELDPQTGSLPIRPRDVKPMWAEIPILYALHKAAPALVRAGLSSGGQLQNSGSPPLPPR